MAPNFKKALNGLKKNVPGGGSSLDLQGLTKTAQNLQSQANKGLQNTPIRGVVPKSLSVLKTFGRPFLSSYSRLRGVVMG